MTEPLTENHLLWWVLKAIDARDIKAGHSDMLLSESLWEDLDAPDWVLPAMREKWHAYNAKPDLPS